MTYFNGRYLRVINPETKVDANNVTVIVRFQWLRHHTASQNFYLLVLLGTEINAMGLIDGSSLEYACCFKFGELVIVT